jgi:holliday junction DNA helicase RuvB
MIESSTNNEIDPGSTNPEEAAFEQTLRPSKLSEYIGQDTLKQNLRVVMAAAKQRGDLIEHALLYGPPGLGKTTLAAIIAKEMGVNLRPTSGPAIQRAGDLAAILTNLEQGDVLFIDEIHRLNKIVEEVLYPAMEDGVLDIVLGKGPGARSIRMDLPKFTLIGATTRVGLLSAPLRDRFGLMYHLDYYAPEELRQIIERSARILNVEVDPTASLELANRSRLTPRIANRLLKRVRDFAQVHEHGTITLDTATKTLSMLEVDSLGLDKHDRKLLETIIEMFRGGPVGLSTLAAATGEEEDTITDIYEPFLMRQGLLTRTPKGRTATRRAYEHLGKNPPAESTLL